MTPPCSLFEQEISSRIRRQVPVEASFGCYRDEIGHDDNCEGGRRDHCGLSVDLAVLEPRGHNEQDGACRNLTTECDETPRIKMYAEHRRAEAPIAWQDMQQDLAPARKGSEQRRDDRHALADRDQASS